MINMHIKVSITNDYVNIQEKENNKNVGGWFTGMRGTQREESE